MEKGDPCEAVGLGRGGESGHRHPAHHCHRRHLCFCSSKVFFPLSFQFLFLEISEINVARISMKMKNMQAALKIPSILESFIVIHLPFESLVWRVFGMSPFAFPLPGVWAAMVGGWTWDQHWQPTTQLPAFLSYNPFLSALFTFNICLHHFMSPFPSQVCKRQCILVGWQAEDLQQHRYSPPPTTADNFLLSFCTKLSVLTKRAQHIITSLNVQ